jgi:hypothetical protein
MSDSTEQLVLWVLSRHRRPDTLEHYQEKSSRLLGSLHSISDYFSNLAATTERDSIPVATDPPQLKRAIQLLLTPDDRFDEYVDLRPGGGLDSNTLSRLGFSITYHSRDVNGLSMADDGGVHLILQGISVGIETNSQAILLMPRRQRDSSQSAVNVRKFLALLLQHWQCDFGGVYLRSFRRVVMEPDLASYAGQWLFYLPFPHLAKCLPPDIHHEPFANGILIETTPHIPGANNPADVAAGKRVRDVLDEFGLVNDATYAIEGWPPDTEESLYEQFISGAPAGRKYTVHCVNFDGYDPDRKVLLYAKLFRRLRRHPKAHGLRGWDGPVLNEAKRQVRAAAKAGGVPIEWHIGLEEPAHAVRQLLAEHTNITDQQLRVIYTPLEQA